MRDMDGDATCDWCWRALDVGYGYAVPDDPTCPEVCGPCLRRARATRARVLALLDADAPDLAAIIPRDTVAYWVRSGLPPRRIVRILLGQPDRPSPAELHADVLAQLRATL